LSHSAYFGHDSAQFGRSQYEYEIDTLKCENPQVIFRFTLISVSDFATILTVSCHGNTGSFKKI